MKYFKNPNIFTLLIVVAAFAFAFRLVNLATFRDRPAATVGAIMPAAAVAGDAAPAMKKEDITEAVKMPEAEEKKAGNPQDLPPPSDSAGETSRAFSTAEIEVLQALSRRRDLLDQREQALAQREALLKAAEAEMDKKIAELSKLQTGMENLLGQQKAAEEKQILSLVKIYENMKPKEAARIFDTLEMDILLSVISRMSERKSSPILAAMDPEKARQLTIQLSEQRKFPAEQAGTAVQ